MDELYRNLGTHKYWDVLPSEADDFEAVEIWHDPASGKASARRCIVPLSSLEEWLAKESEDRGSRTVSLVARLAWLEISKDKKIKLPGDAWARLQKGFGVELAYKYSRSCINGITALPRVSGPGTESQAYSFTYLPKLTTIWSHTRFQRPSQTRNSVTTGIILVDPDYKKPLQIALEAPWDARVCGHALFPAFCIALSFGALIDKTHGEMKLSLREIEEKTGFHAFRREGKPDAKKAQDLAEELGELSQKSNGHATKLASVARKAKMVEKLLQFIVKHTGEAETQREPQAPGGIPGAGDASDTAQAWPDGRGLLRKHATVLEERLSMQEIDMEYTEKRLGVQIDALFHLVSWHDSLSNLTLARSTHEIAEASYRDASSMKTLAVVTMLFLPGSFVSSLFSTDLFDWDSRNPNSGDISVKQTPQMKLYWAITVPLTVLTFVTYFAWLVFLKKERERAYRTEQVQSSVPSEIGKQEQAGTLATALRTQRRGTRLHTRGSSFG